MKEGAFCVLTALDSIQFIGSHDRALCGSVHAASCVFDRGCSVRLDSHVSCRSTLPLGSTLAVIPCPFILLTILHQIVPAASRLSAVYYDCPLVSITCTWPITRDSIRSMRSLFNRLSLVFKRLIDLYRRFTRTKILSTRSLFNRLSLVFTLLIDLYRCVTRTRSLSTRSLFNRLSLVFERLISLYRPITRDSVLVVHEVALQSKVTHSS